MKFNKMGSVASVIGAGVGVVMLVIGVVKKYYCKVIGNVENSTTWTQTTLSGTIGDYLILQPVGV